MESSKRTIELIMQACPMTVSVHWDPVQDTEEDRDKWYDLFKKLPLSVRMALIDEQVSYAIMDLAEKYRLLQTEFVGEISRMVREVFFSDVKEQILKKRIRDVFKLNDYDVEHFFVDFKQVIILVKKLSENRIDSENKKMSVIAALKELPATGEMLIGSKPIKLLLFDQPVKPSVKNWLEDYFSREGVEKHDALKRTDYLFNSENGKKLSASERNKLSSLLKSYDTDEQLTINTTSQEILFDERAGDALEEFFSPKMAQEDLTSVKEDWDDTIGEKNSQNSERTVVSLPKKVTEAPLQAVNLKGQANLEQTKQQNNKGANVVDLSEYM
jgi:hypothetical protein